MVFLDFLVFLGFLDLYLLYYFLNYFENFVHEVLDEDIGDLIKLQNIGNPVPVDTTTEILNRGLTESTSHNAT